MGETEPPTLPAEGTTASPVPTIKPTEGGTLARPAATASPAPSLRPTDGGTLARPVPPPELRVGDSVCITSYVTDIFCILRGTFLDEPDVSALASPERHTFHCLFDVPICEQSGYMVLGGRDERRGEHCLGEFVTFVYAMCKVKCHLARTI